jgi:hypothetical protein
MQLRGVAARVKRLESLSAGLGQEDLRIQKGSDPLLHVERREYLAALRRAARGVETARAVLVKAQQRLQSDQRRE